MELEVEGNVLGRDEGQKRASGKGAVDSQLGLVWREVHILAQRATNLT